MAAEAARPKERVETYADLYTWQGGVDAAGLGIAPRNAFYTRGLGNLMHPAIAASKLNDLSGSINASNPVTTVQAFYDFMVRWGVPEPTTWLAWNSLPSFNNFLTALYSLTQITPAPVKQTLRRFKNTSVKLSFPIDLRTRFLIAANGQFNVDMYYV